MRDTWIIIIVVVLILCMMFSQKENMTPLNNNDIHKVERNITPGQIKYLFDNKCTDCNVKIIDGKPYMGCSCTKQIYVDRGFSGANHNQNYVSKSFDTATDLSRCKIPYKFKYSHNGNNAPIIVCER